MSSLTQHTTGRSRIRSNGKKKACCHENGKGHQHPDHTAVLSRLKRVQGQIGGIERMITERQYCVDILIQFRAAMAALRNTELEVFQSHLRSCVRDTMTSGSPAEAEKKIQELSDLLERRTSI